MVCNFRINQKGFTMLELLIVIAVIGILIALALPNLQKAKMSANEANAKKSMQSLRDAETVYWDLDLDDDNTKNFTSLIGTLTTPNSLRGLDGSANENEALIDNTFEGAVQDDGVGVAMGSGGDTAICIGPITGFCIAPDNEGFNFPEFDFGWGAAPIKSNVSGRRAYAVYEDGLVKATLQSAPKSTPGIYSADSSSPASEQ